MGIIDEAYRNSNHQRKNLWEFRIDSHSRDIEWLFLGRMKSCSLPFIKLSTETRNSGEKVYTGFTPVDSFSITLYEDTDFSGYNYFKDWMGAIFDEREGVFRSYRGVRKGSPQDVIHRTGRLSFEKHIEDRVIVKELVRKQLRTTLGDSIFGKIEANVFGEVFAYSKSEVSSKLNQLLRQGGRDVSDALKIENNIASLVSSVIPDSVITEGIRNNKELQQITKDIKGVINQAQIDVRTYSVSDTRAISDVSFTFENLKIIGIDEVSLDYDDVDGFEYTVELIADNITQSVDIPSVSLPFRIA